MKKRTVGLLALLAMSAFMLSGCMTMQLVQGWIKNAELAKHTTDKKDVVLAEESTPENSVLCYGKVLNTGEGGLEYAFFSQFDENKSPWKTQIGLKKSKKFNDRKGIISDKLRSHVGKKSDLKTNFWANTLVIPPCEPGATLKNLRTESAYYTSYYVNGQYHSVRHSTTYFCPANTMSNFDIQTPKRPGLYYIGAVFTDGSPYNAENLKSRLSASAATGELDNLESNILAHEITATEALLKLYKKTAWESVIQARLEELNAKK